MKKILLGLSFLFFLLWIVQSELQSNKDVVVEADAPKKYEKVYIANQNYEKNDVILTKELTEITREINTDRGKVNNIVPNKSVVGFVANEDIESGDVLTYTSASPQKEEDVVNLISNEKSKLQAYEIKINNNKLGGIPRGEFLGSIDIYGLVNDNINLAVDNTMKRDFDDFELVKVISNVILTDVSISDTSDISVFRLYLTTEQYKRLLISSKFMDLVVLPHDENSKIENLRSNDLYKINAKIKQFRGE